MHIRNTPFFESIQRCRLILERYTTLILKAEGSNNIKEAKSLLSFLRTFRMINITNETITRTTIQKTDIQGKIYNEDVIEIEIHKVNRPRTKEKTIEYNLKLKQIAEKSKDLRVLSKILTKLGGLYDEIHQDYDRSLNYFLKAITIYQKLGYSADLKFEYRTKRTTIWTGPNHMKFSKLISEIISASPRLNKDGTKLLKRPKIPRKNRKYLEKSIIETDMLGMAYVYNRLGNLYQKRRIFHQALIFHQNSLLIWSKIDHEIDRKKMVAGALLSIGIDLKNLGSVRSAIDNLNKAYALYEQINFTNSMKEVKSIINQIKLP